MSRSAAEANNMIKDLALEVAKDPPTFLVHMVLRSANGEPLEGDFVRLSRVPVVGEHVAWGGNDLKDPSHRVTFRVVHVCHCHRADDSILQTAQIYAVEDPTWQGGYPPGWT